MVKIDVTEARANLSETLSRVAYGDLRVLIRRRGRALAAIVSVADLERLEGTRDPDDTRPARGNR